MPPQLPIVEDMPIEEYHAHPYYSKTNIVHARRSTQYVIDMRKNPPDPSPAQALGSAFHKIVLENGMVGEEIILVDAGVRRGKVWDEAVKNNPGKILLLAKENEDLTPMVDSVRTHKRASQLLKQGMPEVSFFAKLDLGEDQLPVKCRPDWLPGALQIVDLKTAREVEPEPFGRAAYNFHYHWSAWLSCKIVELVTGQPHVYYFIATENKYPHTTVCYQVRPQVQWLAEQEIFPVLVRLAEAHNKNRFKEIAPDTILDLELPYWAMKRVVNE